jgi:hypothetical protein
MFFCHFCKTFFTFSKKSDLPLTDSVSGLSYIYFYLGLLRGERTRSGAMPDSHRVPGISVARLHLSPQVGRDFFLGFNI